MFGQFAGLFAMCRFFPAADGRVVHRILAKRFYVFCKKSLERFGPRFRETNVDHDHACGFLALVNANITMPPASDGDAQSRSASKIVPAPPNDG
jgi:hypothetical protein